MPWDPSRWLALEKYEDSFPKEFGAWLLLDWGDTVTGLLSLELASDAGTPGLFHVGTEIPDRAAPAAGLVIPIPGQTHWVDTCPRTFRYVLLAGVEPREVPEVWSVGAGLACQSAPSDAGRPGVFGIAPPRQDSLVEEKIRLRLHPPATSSR